VLQTYGSCLKVKTPSLSAKFYEQYKCWSQFHTGKWTSFHLKNDVTYVGLQFITSTGVQKFVKLSYLVKLGQKVLFLICKFR